LKILGEKYKNSRRHLEYRRHFDFTGLGTNFLQCSSASTISYPSIRTFHSAVPLPKNQEFLWIKSAILNFSRTYSKIVIFFGAAADENWLNLNYLLDNNYSI
jgi:hypothetical protein